MKFLFRLKIYKGYSVDTKDAFIERKLKWMINSTKLIKEVFI